VPFIGTNNAQYALSANDLAVSADLFN